MGSAAQNSNNGAYDADADQDHEFFDALEHDPGAEPGGADDGVSVCVYVCVCCVV